MAMEYWPGQACSKDRGRRMSYCLVRVKRRWIPEWIWRTIFCHALGKLTVRWPLKQITTRKVSEFEDYKYNGRL